MKCTVETTFCGTREEISVSKERDELFTESERHNLRQAITLLDETFLDTRAALLARMSKEEQEDIPVVVLVDDDTAQEIAKGKR